jgi:hypothetical protein
VLAGILLFYVLSLYAGCDCLNLESSMLGFIYIPIFICLEGEAAYFNLNL